MSGFAASPALQALMEIGHGPTSTHSHAGALGADITHPGPPAPSSTCLQGPPWSWSQEHLLFDQPWLWMCSVRPKAALIDCLVEGGIL